LATRLMWTTRSVRSRSFALMGAAMGFDPLLAGA
jgi:hypothetical protein